MPCTHVGPHELIEMAEKHLHESGVPVEEWPGRRFAVGQNLTDDMWASVALEVERRGDQWVVVRIDRNASALPEEQLGFRAVNR